MDINREGIVTGTYPPRSSRDFAAYSWTEISKNPYGTDFLNTANFVDAGNSALHDACDVSLGDRVAQFLGDGDWAPHADYTEIDA